MIYILYDKPKSIEDMSFVSSQINKKYIEIYPDIRCNSIKKVYLFAEHVFKRFSKNDTIVCWYDFMGVIFYCLSKIHRKPLNIIGLNILLKDKKTIKNRVAKFLYKKALLDSKFYATVTTVEYGNKINAVLGIDKAYYLLHDPYHSTFKYEKQSKSFGYVFCGGRNGRDWGLMIEIAKSLQDILFTFVMAEADFLLYQNEIPQNVNIKKNIPYNEFMDSLCGASIVALPLDTWAPAGLTVLFQAIANEKLVLTTSTVSTDEYLEAAPNLLCHTIDDWKSKIRFYLDNEQERNISINRVKKDIEQKCAEEKYSEIIKNIIEVVEEKNKNV